VYVFITLVFFLNRKTHHVDAVSRLSFILSFVKKQHTASGKVLLWFAWVLLETEGREA